MAVKDRQNDVRGPLDVVRVALDRGVDGRLRGEVTMREEWGAGDMRAASGHQGSVCLVLHTVRDPTSEPPDWLVCASPPASGEELVGRVLRDRANGLPRRVAAAAITRPTTRTLYLRFAQSAIGRPAQVRFRAEAVSRARGCSRPLGCRDTAPNAPETATLTLR